MRGTGGRDTLSDGMTPGVSFCAALPSPSQTHGESASWMPLNPFASMRRMMFVIGILTAPTSRLYSDFMS